MYKLAIFDLDGTLLNTLGDLAAAGNHALKQMGKPCHAEESYKLFVGNGIPNLIHRILPEEHSDEEHQHCYELFTAYYSEHKSDRTVPYDGIAALLKQLNSEGITCVVNTNKAHDFSKELLTSCFENNISDLIGYGAGFPAKPAPDAALELCRRHGADIHEAIYIGDSNVDMQTAAAARLDSCAVLWGFRSQKELSACSPKFMVSSAEELYTVIREVKQQQNQP